jgi:UDP-2-acetamido-2,6-beta-L-arabino-hexul-4-ose reductase
MKHTVLITGANGFLGKNLVHQLGSEPDFEILQFTRQTTSEDLDAMLNRCTAIIHTAGSNRPENEIEFERDNVELLAEILLRLEAQSPKPIVFTSSTQAGNGTPYGQSKLEAEVQVRSFCAKHGVRGRVLRLPNVFGKWSRPNYNSVVATFVHNASRGLPMRIDDPFRVIDLVYVDDFVATIKRDIREDFHAPSVEVTPIYRTTVGALSAIVAEIHKSRQLNEVLQVGTGLMRALYATYVSALAPSNFKYPLSQNKDHRGTFVEFLRTPNAGQISFLTAKPGITRGSHVHHTKVEKFVVVQGIAKFRFKNLLNGELHEIATDHRTPHVVESIPGWAHDITNTGSDELVIIVWASENFDRDNPDTVGVVIKDAES